MDILSIILLSVGLAMDCFAVSIAKGLATQNSPQWGWAVLMALLFGLFQGGMPLIGYFAGVNFADFFSRFSHWIALFLLGCIGGKMVWEGCRHKPASEQSEEQNKSFSLPLLLLLAVATSIDALATGVLFIPCPEVLWLAVIVIALGSLLFSLIGYLIGLRFGRQLKINADIIGGIILIGIGLKIFIEHYL